MRDRSCERWSGILTRQGSFGLSTRLRCVSMGENLLAMPENQESAFAVTNSRGLPFPCPISRHGGASRRDYARGLLFRTNLNIILRIMALALSATPAPLMTEHETRNGFRIRPARGYHLNFAILDKLNDHFFTALTHSCVLPYLSEFPAFVRASLLQQARSSYVSGKEFQISFIFSDIQCIYCDSCYL